MDKQMTREESLDLLIKTIEDEGNAFSIQVPRWDLTTKNPSDSFLGECGTPACIIGWEGHLIRSFQDFCECIEDEEIYMPEYDDLTTDGNSYYRNPRWFTRARTVAMLKHYRDTNKVDWQALEKSNV